MCHSGEHPNVKGLGLVCIYSGLAPSGHHWPKVDRTWGVVLTQSHVDSNPTWG